MPDKKYYWLKLKRDFFKRHDIQIIESMPNGKDYVLFYLKLLAESVDHEGALRFSDTVPYNEQMLSTITNTNVDIVRAAMKVFTELGMIDMLDDHTIYMNEVQAMLGGETYWAEKKRRQRIGQCPTDVPLLSGACPTCPSKSKSKIQSESIDIDKDSISSDLQSDKCISIDNVFEKTYKIYPRHDNGKAKGKELYMAYLKGRTITGQGKIKFNHQQIYFAVQVYADEMQGHDTKYVKLFSVFMHLPVIDYVEKSKEAYEAWMFEKYGNDWRDVKFRYTT